MFWQPSIDRISNRSENGPGAFLPTVGILISSRCNASPHSRPPCTFLAAIRNLLISILRGSRYTAVAVKWT